MIKRFQQLLEHVLGQPVVGGTIEGDLPAKLGGSSDRQRAFLFRGHGSGCWVIGVGRRSGWDASVSISSVLSFSKSVSIFALERRIDSGGQRWIVARCRE